jgi:hypothetical protein
VTIERSKIDASISNTAIEKVHISYSTANVDSSASWNGGRKTFPLLYNLCRCLAKWIQGMYRDDTKKFLTARGPYVKRRTGVHIWKEQGRVG